MPYAHTVLSRSCNVQQAAISGMFVLPPPPLPPCPPCRRPTLTFRTRCWQNCRRLDWQQRTVRTDQTTLRNIYGIYGTVQHACKAYICMHRCIYMQGIYLHS